MDLRFYLLHFLNLSEQETDEIIEIHRRYPYTTSSEMKKLVLSVLHADNHVRIEALEEIFRGIHEEVEDNAFITESILNSGLHPNPTLAEIIPFIEQLDDIRFRGWIWFYVFDNWESFNIHQITIPMLESILEEIEQESRELVLGVFFGITAQFVHLEFPFFLHFTRREGLIPDNERRAIYVMFLMEEWLLRRGITLSQLLPFMNRDYIPDEERLRMTVFCQVQHSPLHDLPIWLQTIVSADLSAENRSRLLYYVIYAYLDEISRIRSLNPGDPHNIESDLDTIRRYATQVYMLPIDLNRLLQRLRRRVLRFS
jgi:hypothetical protein